MIHGAAVGGSKCWVPVVTHGNPIGVWMLVDPDKSWWIHVVMDNGGNTWWILMDPLATSGRKIFRPERREKIFTYHEIQLCNLEVRV